MGSDQRKNQEQLPELCSSDSVAHKSPTELLQDLSGRLSRFEESIKAQVENYETHKLTREAMERSVSDIVSGLNENQNLLKSIEALSHEMKIDVDGCMRLDKTKYKTKSPLAAVVPVMRLTCTPVGLMDQDPLLVRRVSSAAPGKLFLTPRYQQ